MTKIQFLRNLKTVNVFKYLTVMVVTTFCLSLLHGALALSSEWYRSEVFDKAGIIPGAIITSVVAVSGGSLVVNAMVGRGKPRRFVKWIQEVEQAPNNKGQS